MMCCETLSVTLRILNGIVNDIVLVKRIRFCKTL